MKNLHTQLNYKFILINKTKINNNILKNIGLPHYSKLIINPTIKLRDTQKL